MTNKRLKLMQLSLVDEVPELNKIFFLDVFAESFFDLGKKNQQKPIDIELLLVL